MLDKANKNQLTLTGTLQEGVFLERTIIMKKTEQVAIKYETVANDIVSIVTDILQDETSTNLDYSSASELLEKASYFKATAEKIRQKINN